MSISVQRQYSSPNCILSLQGFTDEDNGSGEGMPVMTVLTLAQCQIVGNPNVLTGGLTLIQNLVKAVSAYSQEMLSGIDHSSETVDDSDYIAIGKLPNKNRHKLLWQEKKDQTEPQIEMELTTVQLFDLLETVDQLFADRNTLPQLEDQLQPLSRRHRRAEQSMVEQSTPATVGIASLALAAIALFLIPYPTEIKDPNLEPKVTPQTTETVPEDVPITIPPQMP